MDFQDLSRREILKTGSAAVGITLAQMAMPDFAFPGESENEEHVPFLNMPRVTRKILDWETLDSWITPQDQVFNVSHYGDPKINKKDFKLEITGMVDHPKTLSLEQLKKLPQKDQLMTLECSGNGAFEGFIGGIFNSKWTGTPLTPLLKSCGIQDGATEVVFFGIDRKEEKIKNVTVEVPFGRSMSLDDALNKNCLLTHTRNGEAMEDRNGAPLRLIVPGWYGIANVKWLHRIEVRNQRYMGRYMARDYVTLRGEKHQGEVVFVETSVTKMNLKSIIARVTRRPTQDGQVPIKAYGAVWSDGTPIKKVEVKVDEDPWREAILDKEPRSKYCWTFFSIDLKTLKPGKHNLVSRAVDINGRVQPAADDDEIALKKTYYEAYQQLPREIELES